VAVRAHQPEDASDHSPIPPLGTALSPAAGGWTRAPS
jgi:hypothetical protein